MKSSYCFSREIGKTYSAATIKPADYTLHAERFLSEGNWAFCRFNENRFIAARIGFERGSFNITDKPQDYDPDLLQLHIELMTDEGAVLRVPTGKYSAADVVSSSKKFSISMKQHEKKIFSMDGWPVMYCHFISEERKLEMQLRFELSSCTILPDCMLPYSIFSMWESIGDIDGSIRYKDETVTVSGKHEKCTSIQQCFSRTAQHFSDTMPRIRPESPFRHIVSVFLSIQTERERIFQKLR